MVLRRIGMSSLGSSGAQWLNRLNGRHPWSHNDYFHSWILANLPEQRSSALDVGCGRGGLVHALAPLFGHVTGADIDAEMRAFADHRVGGIDNAAITDRRLESWEDSSFDLVTMVAVLHHLDVGEALKHVRRILTPQGRLLVVGLAPPKSIRDHVWDAVSIVINPLIGWVHHPWPHPAVPRTPPFPVRDPELSFDELENIVRRTLPGATMRHRIGFRHTIEWTELAESH